MCKRKRNLHCLQRLLLQSYKTIVFGFGLVYFGLSETVSSARLTRRLYFVITRNYWFCYRLPFSGNRLTVHSPRVKASGATWVSRSSARFPKKRSNGHVSQLLWIARKPVFPHPRPEIPVLE